METRGPASMLDFGKSIWEMWLWKFTRTHGDYHANCYWTFSWTVLRKTARQHIFGLLNCGEISARICVARAFAAIFVGEVAVEDRSGLDWITNN